MKAAQRAYAQLVTDHPGARQVAHALVRRGRHLLKSGQVSAAIALFESFVESGRADCAEAALVGLMGSRLQRGERAEVVALLARYDKRFTSGSRSAEVARIRAAVGAKNDESPAGSDD